MSVIGVFTGKQHLFEKKRRKIKKKVIIKEPKAIKSR